MDINHIFGLFDQTNFETPLIEKAKAVAELFTIQDTAVFWVGMFKKIIQNDMRLYSQISKHLPPEVLDEMSMGSITEFITYNRAWYYISKLDLNNQTHIDAVITFSDQTLSKCLNSAIYFFEGREEYEKCSFLKIIHEKVEKLLNKA